jgi:hypothetical protein
MNAAGKETIVKFAESLRGDVLLPGDPAYEVVGRDWLGTMLKRPALIVRCAETSDVVRAVHFGQEHDLLVAVRAGGHGVDSTCDGGMVINLSLMKDLHVDPNRHLARAQPGVSTGEFDRATSAAGLATVLGECPSVGISGLTLGGGLGRLMGLHGATCDNLLSAEDVTADGTVLTASAQENEDLFWGIRGGGGNFGVVTSLEYRLHPIGPVLAGALQYPISEVARVLSFFRDYMKTVPDGADATVEIGRGVHQYIPNTEEPARAVAVCCMDNLQRAKEELAPLRAYGQPSADTIQPMSYGEAQASADHRPYRDLVPAGYAGYLKCAFVTDLEDEVIDTIVAYAAKAKWPAWCISLDHYMHGAVCRTSRADTAFSLRQTGYSVRVVAAWQLSAGPDEPIEWARQFCNALQPFSGGTIYANYLTDEGEAGVKAAYGPNLSRLVALKRKYDPTNFFRLNPNVRPSLDVGSDTEADGRGVRSGGRPQPEARRGSLTHGRSLAANRSASASSRSFRMLHIISFRDTLTACTSFLARRYANFGHSTPTANMPLLDGSKSCSGTTSRALRPCVPPSPLRIKSEISLSSTLVGTNTGSSPPSISTGARSISAMC